MVHCCLAEGNRIAQSTKNVTVLFVNLSAKPFGKPPTEARMGPPAGVAKVPPCLTANEFDGRGSNHMIGGWRAAMAKSGS